ncbi:hypothetical protein HDU93_007914 [Gonapodya sp. JEL0774]|nr:hypothetical protein HDU93_007914 [Gonapodya sp. JEL0774]
MSISEKVVTMVGSGQSAIESVREWYWVVGRTYGDLIGISMSDFPFFSGGLVSVTLSPSGGIVAHHVTAVEEDHTPSPKSFSLDPAYTCDALDPKINKTPIWEVVIHNNRVHQGVGDDDERSTEQWSEDEVSQQPSDALDSINSHTNLRWGRSQVQVLCLSRPQSDRPPPVWPAVASHPGAIIRTLDGWMEHQGDAFSSRSGVVGSLLSALAGPFPAKQSLASTASTIHVTNVRPRPLGKYRSVFSRVSVPPKPMGLEKPPVNVKEGVWVGTYGGHGLEFLFVTADISDDHIEPPHWQLRFEKLTGDVNVPRGATSLQAYLHLPIDPRRAPVRRTSQTFAMNSQDELSVVEAAGAEGAEAVSWDLTKAWEFREGVDGGMDTGELRSDKGEVKIHAFPAQATVALTGYRNVGRIEATGQ